MSTSISGFIIVFTLANILGCLWLLWWTARSRNPASVDTAADKTGHVWDGDLEEYNKPLPRWWLGLFILTIVFSIAYLIWFPGLGSFAGTSGWTQLEEHRVQVAAARERVERRLATLENVDLATLGRDPQAMALAKNLFAANCSLCHGSDARGAKGYPNLTDGDWLWGAEPATVLTSIGNGRHGVMPALGSALGAEGLNEVASYVFSLNGRRAPADWVAAGKTRFDTICAACHGADAKGNPLLGAPNLTDSVWLHGGDLDSIRTTIAAGRNSEMPPQLATLGATRVRLLAAYVLSLSATRSEAAPEALAAQAGSDATTH